MRITAFARTDVGKVRPANEDDFFVGEQVFAVADGMGGHAAGEVAAKTALEPLLALDAQQFETAEDAEEALAEALREANRQVVEKAEAEPELQGMGTTLTAGLLLDGRMHLAHVGDSRAYLLREGEAITQLTTDHTLVERLVRDGRLTRADAETHPQRNVVTRAIGNESDVVVDSLPGIRLQPGDQILLCSDGLTGPLTDSDIAATLTHNSDGDEAVDALIQHANDAGGPDNVTAVLVRVEAEEGEPLAPADDRQVRQIRTRRAVGSDGDWANRLGQLGAPQGASVSRKRRNRNKERSGAGKRVLAALLGVLMIAGVAGGGGWMLLSRAYFVGAYNGQVAIFRGVPEQVWNVPLHRVIEDEVTDLSLSEFPAWRQEAVEDGIHAGTIEDARRIVSNLESIAEPDAPAEEDRIEDGSDDGADEDGDPDDEDAGGT